MPFDAIATDLALLHAETIGKAYKHCGYPYILDTLNKPDVFSLFFNEATKPLVMVSQESGGDIESFNKDEIEQFAPAQEAANIIAKHEHNLSDASRKQPYPFYTWYTQHGVYMSSRREHGRLRHIDGELSARQISSLAVNEGDSASLIVPHSHAYNVLSNSPFAKLLKQPLNDRDETRRSGRRFNHNYHPHDPRHWRNFLQQILSPSKKYRARTLAMFKETSDALFAGAIPMPTNTVYRMSVITPHVQPEKITRERVCLVSNTYYRQKSHPDW